MQRDLMEELKAWKVDKRRKPLILRGARQVGKSFLVKEFARNFDYYIELNLELTKQHKEIFSDDLNAEIIVQRLRFITNIKIVPGKTLLFIDEIQESEQALLALRYFKEQMPDLHVIAAGSLLDFALEKVGMPVGRVQFLYLHPLSFAEFLTVSGFDDLRQHIKLETFDTVLHKKLLQQLKTYFWLGGMPEAVATWLATKNVNDCMAVHDEIIQSYIDDIPKYSKYYLIDHIEQVFNAIPNQLGNKFVFKNIDPEIRSYKLKEALFCLEKAGIAHIVYHTDAQGLPLKAGIKSRRFKVYGFDIGLMQRLLNFNPSRLLTKPLAINHVGNIAEQFVAQEYIAHSPKNRKPEIFYWHREDKITNAEVDFVFTSGDAIYPVEVKSSAKGHLKSLRMFAKTHKTSQTGIKISEAEFEQGDDLLSLPFYMIEAWCSQGG